MERRDELELKNVKFLVEFGKHVLLHTECQSSVYKQSEDAASNYQASTLSSSVWVWSGLRQSTYFIHHICIIVSIRRFQAKPVKFKTRGLEAQAN